MNCNVVAARFEPCKEYIGGIQGIFLIPFVWSDIITIDANGAVSAIDDASSTPVTGYFWELKGTSSFQSVPTASRDGGTVAHEQTITVNFKPKNKVQPWLDREEIETILQGRWRVVVWDRNDNFWLVGKEFGADATGGAENWGSALTDPRTNEIVLVGNEPKGPTPLAADNYTALSSIFTINTTP